MNINTRIKVVASLYIGQKEIIGNKGFENAVFEDKMESCGWDVGQAWCAYFTELVWKEAYELYKPEVIPVLDKLFSAGAVKTFNNFNKSPKFQTSKNPAVGAVVIWQYYKNGKPHWSGHAGIVSESVVGLGNKFKTIEGNTNSQGGREGIEVAEKTRLLDFSPKTRGLVLKGFIYPQE